MNKIYIKDNIVQIILTYEIVNQMRKNFKEGKTSLIYYLPIKKDEVEFIDETKK